MLKFTGRTSSLYLFVAGDVECNAMGSYPEIGSTNGVTFDQLSVDEGIDMSEVGALCTIDHIPAKKLKVNRPSFD